MWFSLPSSFPFTGMSGNIYLTVLSRLSKREGRIEIETLFWAKRLSRLILAQVNPQKF